MLKRLFTFMMMICLLAMVYAGGPVTRTFTTAEPMIAVELQWCYKPHPSLATMLRTLDAAVECGYNTLIPEFGPSASWSEAPEEYQEAKRTFLRACVRRGIFVIPKINALGHSDRGFRWPAYLGKGLDLGVSENYTALEKEVEVWKKELEAAGQGMPYFHLGMDEASRCMKENSAKYNKEAHILLVEHLRKVNEICKRQGMRGIIYHDMLVGGSESINWREFSTVNADANATWKARKDISRDFILAYWNYEPFNRYRTVENLRSEGFDVLFTPWGSEPARTMVKNARLYGIGVCASTWVEFTALPRGGKIRGNSIYLNGWISDALSSMPWHYADAGRAEISWRPNHGLPWIRGFMKRRPLENDHAARPLPINGGNAGDVRMLAGLPFIEAQPIRLGARPDAEYPQLWAKALENASRPLKLMAGKQILQEIRHCNVPPIFGERVLYTRAYGRETGMDVYSREYRIVDGVNQSNNDWGIGRTIIPLNGFVVSGWGEQCIDGMKPAPKGEKIRICDSNGKEILPAREVVTMGPEKAEIPVKRKVKQLHILHSSALEGSMEAPALAEISILDEKGAAIRTETVYYGSMVAAENENMLASTDEDDVWLAEADQTHTLYGFTITLDKAEMVGSLLIQLTDEGKRLGYIVHALTTAE